jgi:hypothetical protein
MRTARLCPGTWLASLLVLLIATACTDHSGAGPTRAEPTPARLIPIAATVSPTAPVGSPTTAAVPRMLTGPSPQITPDLAGQVVQLPAGASFLVNLGGDVDWLVRWTPADAVRPVLTTTRPAGSQGYYTITDAPDAAPRRPPVRRGARPAPPARCR